MKGDVNIALAVIIGIAAGIISGMGIGGGAILIPALVIFLGIEQHMVQGINLVFFIPTAIAALIIHIKNKNIVASNIVFIIISGIIGAFIGSTTAAFIPSQYLRKIFSVFLFLMGGYEVYNGFKAKNKIAG